MKSERSLYLLPPDVDMDEDEDDYGKLREGKNHDEWWMWSSLCMEFSFQYRRGTFSPN